MNISLNTSTNKRNNCWLSVRDSTFNEKRKKISVLFIWDDLLLLRIYKDIRKSLTVSNYLMLYWTIPLNGKKIYFLNPNCINNIRGIYVTHLFCLSMAVMFNKVYGLQQIKYTCAHCICHGLQSSSLRFLQIIFK